MEDPLTPAPDHRGRRMHRVIVEYLGVGFCLTLACLAAILIIVIIVLVRVNANSAAIDDLSPEPLVPTDTPTPTLLIPASPVPTPEPTPTLLIPASPVPTPTA